MKFRKKLAVLLAVFALVGGVGISSAFENQSVMLTVSAETTGTYKCLTYTLYDDHAVITGFDNTVADVVIPSQIELLPVTEIAQNAFLNATRLKTVEIPDSVTVIGVSAFNTATALESVTLPENLQSIGNYAFHKCISLKEIILPESLNFLGTYAFYGCVSMQSATLAGSITSLPTQAFSNCTSLTDIYIPLGITYLNNSSGSYNASLAYCPIQDVYYEGSQVQWNAITDKFLSTSVVVHYGSPNPPKKVTPDLNEDGVINAVDAAIVLQYAAYVGANNYIEIAEFLVMKDDNSN